MIRDPQKLTPENQSITKTSYIGHFRQLNAIIGHIMSTKEYSGGNFTQCYNIFNYFSTIKLENDLPTN